MSTSGPGRESVENAPGMRSMLENSEHMMQQSPQKLANLNKTIDPNTEDISPSLLVTKNLYKDSQSNI